MADINQIITLGIGTPSGVLEFITLGLQIGEEVVPPTLTPSITLYAKPERQTFVVEPERQTFKVAP